MYLRNNVTDGPHAAFTGGGNDHVFEGNTVPRAVQADRHDQLDPPAPRVC